MFLYAINIWVWQISPAGDVSNVHSAIAALIIIGMIFLVLPSLYLGSKWYKLKIEYSGVLDDHSEAEEKEKPEEYEYHDVRPKNAQRLANILDYLFAISLILIFIWQYRHAGPIEYVVELITEKLRAH